MLARHRLGPALLVALGLLAGSACTPAGPSAARAPAAPSGATSAVPAAPQAGSAAAPTSAAGALVPIRIAFSQVAAAFAPVWIAHDQGLFQKHGLDAEVVN